MPYIDITSEVPTQLSKLGVPTIMIKEVQVIGTDIHDLFHPIRISTTLPDGRFYQSLFHPMGYWSNMNADLRTDRPINVSIHYCPFTELQIDSKEKVIQHRIIYQPLIKEQLIVKVSKDLDGYNFSLPEESVEVIMAKNPNAKPVRNIFVSYDVKQSFHALVGKLNDYILPALTDLTPKELSEIKVKSFIDAFTNREIESI